jgi:hypothetical protein
MSIPFISASLYATICISAQWLEGVDSVYLAGMQVRMVEARPGIAFVDFENDMQSATAMQGLQGFKITPTHAMQISFARQ